MTYDEIFKSILSQIKAQSPQILKAVKPEPTMDRLVDQILQDQLKRHSSSR